MIKFSNGHRMDFATASGALAWYGEGWWWEKPFFWAGLIDPEKITIISKTLTLKPRKGNLDMLRPWRCVRLIPGGAVNAVGLTNPGLQWWIDNFPESSDNLNAIIASIMPADAQEAEKMAKALTPVPIVGIELNVSCPNIDGDVTVTHVANIVEAVKANTKHPLILKLNYADPYLEICKNLDGKVDAFDLINAVPWGVVRPGEPSPLSKYSLEGGVSGLPIREYSREALIKVRFSGVKTPIISGGGIDCVNEVYARFVVGASAVTLGTVFLRSPWKPMKIIEECRKAWSSAAR